MTNFRARIHGRIHAGVDRPWMPFVGEQVNTYRNEPNRLFFITAAMKGLPTDIFHEFVDESATMTVKVFSLITVVDARGPDMNRSETVTILDAMCVLAPAALNDPALTWTALSAERDFDGRRVMAQGEPVGTHRSPKANSPISAVTSGV